MSALSPPFFLACWNCLKRASTSSWSAIRSAIASCCLASVFEAERILLVVRPDLEWEALVPNGMVFSFGNVQGSDLALGQTKSGGRFIWFLPCPRFFCDNAKARFLMEISAPWHNFGIVRHPDEVRTGSPTPED